MHHLLKTMIIFAWSQYLKKLVSVREYAGSSSIFLQIKTLVELERPSCYINGSLSASSKISFHGLPSKNKCPSIRKYSIVVIITVNSISFYETAICKEIFSKYFSQISKYIPKSFQNFTEIHPWKSLMLVKLQTFTGATTGCIL